MNGIRLITFDLDNTLWDNDPVITRAENRLYQWLQDNCPKLAERFSADELIRLRLELLEQDPALAASISELRRRSLAHAMEAVGYTCTEAEELSQQAMRIFLDARNQVSLYPGARETLLALRSEYTLGALTNGNVEPACTPAADLFDFHINAEQAGERKPGAQQFRMAMAISNTRAKQCIHIGDHPLDDIIGASRLGIHSLWFNPEGKSWDETRYGEQPASCFASCDWQTLAGLIREISQRVIQATA